jgi:glycosyltransferase involved in cell wall biosynthesis
MIGRHSPQKDHPALFRALAQIKDQPWIIDLVGTGPHQDRHEAMVRELGLAQRVSFLGYRKDVPELMAAADVYVLASNWEGLPRSIIEAMRAGLATISSDVGGCREMVRDGETGYLVPRGDAAALAGRMADLIGDRQQQRILGANARRLFEQHFLFDNMFGGTLALYEEILAKQPAVG